MFMMNKKCLNFDNHETLFIYIKCVEIIIVV